MKVRRAPFARTAGWLDHDAVGALLGQQHRRVGGAEVGVELEDVYS